MSPVAGKGVAWRTLRLQPDPTDAPSDVPDWALLDAFAIPPSDIDSTNVSKLRIPNSLARGGQVNVNATLAPTNMTANLRLGGLAALLAGARKDSTNTFTAAEAETIAQNVALQILAEGSARGRSFGRSEIFDSPAEVVEIKGVADRGEESENTARDMLALATNRGNVFTIFSIGQALKQTPKNTLLVMAEKRRQVTLERVETVTTATTPATSETKFRTIYSRDLHP